LSPPKKLKIMSHLTEAQRYKISALKQAGFFQKDIAKK
jgi:IS30 family transposase